MIYKVKNSESIGDVVLNATGDLSAWGEICDLNGFDSWTPDLQIGQEIQFANIINQNVLNSLPSISNFPNLDNKILSLINILSNGDLTTYITDNLPDINAQILYIEKTLRGITIQDFKQPIIQVTKNIYIVKQGETITDVVLNATGSLDNWETILNINNFTEWTPTLYVGQEIIIDYLSLQKNNLIQFNQYPICNDSGIQDLDTQISILISNFDNNMLFDDDLVQVEFDDDLTDAQFN
jgi:hypothetical protein